MLPVILASPARSRSASLPRRPMTMPGPGGVDVDAQAVAGALDLDAADGRVRQLGHEVVADLPVLDDVVAVLVAVGEPARLPVGGDAEAEPVGVDLLAHLLVLFSVRRLGRRRLVAVSSAAVASAASAADFARRRSSARLVDLHVVGGLVGRHRPRRSRSSVCGLVLSSLVPRLARFLGRWLGAAARRTRARRAATSRPRRPRPAPRRRPSRAGGDAARARLGHPADDDRDVAGALADARGPAAGPGTPPLERRALVGEAGRHVELVGVDLVVVLGVGHRRRRGTCGPRPPPRGR